MFRELPAVESESESERFKVRGRAEAKRGCGLGDSPPRPRYASRHHSESRTRHSSRSGSLYLRTMSALFSSSRAAVRAVAAPSAVRSFSSTPAPQATLRELEGRIKASLHSYSLI